MEYFKATQIYQQNLPDTYGMSLELIDSLTFHWYYGKDILIEAQGTDI